VKQITEKSHIVQRSETSKHIHNEFQHKKLSNDNKLNEISSLIEQHEVFFFIKKISFNSFSSLIENFSF